MGRTVVVGGALAQKPGRGGLTWVFLQYVLGFRRLGWDVLFLDRLEPEMCVDDAGNPVSLEDSINLRYLTEVMDTFGLSGQWSLIFDGTRFVGLPRDEVVDRVRRSTFLLNIMGYLNRGEILDAARRRVFLDIDPGFPQMWRELGLADLFDGHDQFVTVGRNLGRANCTIPDCGLEWIGTAQPVVLDHWSDGVGAQGHGFTSVVTWRGPFAPIEYRGKTYGLRVHEFRKFAELPRLTGARFEVALDIHSADQNDRAMLESHGWSIADPKAVVADPRAYQRYIQRSAAEFGVAKNMYVDTRSGWFSDRTICYLALGKPALVQDTGLENLYRLGEGVLTFSTLDEAVAGVETICRDYERHSRAARRVAEECFDSDKVLSRLLRELDVT